MGKENWTHIFNAYIMLLIHIYYTFTSLGELNEDLDAIWAGLEVRKFGWLLIWCLSLLVMLVLNKSSINLQT